jgi:hypothetical protein
MSSFDKLKKMIIKERLTPDLEKWYDDELFFFDCNEDACEYYLNVAKQLDGKKISNKNNSLIAYLLGITDDKPSQEINASPATLPDIDYDTNARDQAKNYLVYKFGRDRVTLMGTFGTLKTKGAVKDILRQMRSDMTFKEVNELTKHFDKLKRTDYGPEEEYFNAALKEVPDLGNWFEQNEDIKDAVLKILGAVKSTGVHAGGIVVAGDDVTRIVPCVFERKKDQMWVTQPDMKYVEWAGLIKYDFLGLNTLNDIGKCFRLIEKRTGKVLSMDKIPKNDPTVMRMFRNGETMSVFQFGTFLAHSIITQLKEVRNINDLAIITSIARPGPLEMGMDKTFINRVNGKEPITYFHPSLEPILKDTYGIACIAKDSLVLTKRGQVKIQEVNVGDFVKTENGSWQKVLKNINQGIKPTIKIRVSNGEELICTKDHKILTQDGWKEAQFLTKKDIIKSFWVEKERKNVGDLKDWLIGLSLADGDLVNSTTTISCSSESFAQKVSLIAEKAFGLKNCKVYFKERCWYVSLGHFNKNDHGLMRNHPFKDELKKHEINNLNCYTKRLPKNISLMMIAGFIEGDGCLRNSKIRLKNKELAYDVYKSLQSYRIPSSFYIDIDGASTVTFHDYENKLPFQVKERLFVSPRAMYYPRSYVNKKYSKKDGLLYQITAPKKVKGVPYITHSSFIKTKIKPEHDLWSKVLSIKDNKEEQVFDLSVENIHSFVVGGLVVHNCYQEQVMLIVRELGGLSGNESVVVLKAMGKKQLDKLVKFKGQFMKNCIEKYPEMANLVDFEDPETKEMKKVQLTEKIWLYLEAFAKYGFNKSHAIAYSTVSYICMWLKHYYKLEWIAAVLSNSSKDDFKQFYAQWHHFILKPDINKSKSEYVIEKVGTEEKTIMPFSFINGLGDKAVDAIMMSQPYASFEDFFTRVDKKKVNKNAFINLIFAGAFDSLKEDFAQPIADYRKLLIQRFFELKAKVKKPSKKEKEEQQEIMNEVNAMNRGKFLMKEVSLLNLTAFNYFEFYKEKMTRDALGRYGMEAVTPGKAKQMNHGAQVVVGGAIESIRFITIKNGKSRGKEMAIISLINEEQTISVTVFPDYLEKDASGKNAIRELAEFTPVIFKGKIRVDEKYGTSLTFEKGEVLV